MDPRTEAGEDNTRGFLQRVLLQKAVLHMNALVCLFVQARYIGSPLAARGGLAPLHRSAAYACSPGGRCRTWPCSSEASEPHRIGVCANNIGCKYSQVTFVSRF